MEQIKADDKKKLEIMDDELEQISGGIDIENMIRKTNKLFDFKNDISDSVFNSNKENESDTYAR